MMIYMSKIIQEDYEKKTSLLSVGPLWVRIVARVGNDVVSSPILIAACSIKEYYIFCLCEHG